MWIRILGCCGEWEVWQGFDDIFEWFLRDSFRIKWNKVAYIGITCARTENRHLDFFYTTRPDIHSSDFVGTL